MKNNYSAVKHITPAISQQIYDTDNQAPGYKLGSSPLSPYLQPFKKAERTTSDKHEDMMGLWFLREINGENKQKDMIFYEITSSQMKLLSYGNYKQYKSYKYLYSNGTIHFGNGPFKIKKQNRLLVLSASDYKCDIVFEPVTSSNIQSIASSNKMFVNTSKNTQYVKSKDNSDLRQYMHKHNKNIQHITDIDRIFRIIHRAYWHSFAYMYGNNSLSHIKKHAEINFSRDLTFTLKNSSGVQKGKYRLTNEGLIMTYSDGFREVHTNIYIDYNPDSKLYYLYISEDCDKYEGCYSVFESKEK